MRIAVLADIHGNLLALEAVLADLDGQDVDEIWCGGDIAWGGPWPSDCIARVRDGGWRAVKGNTDVWITGDPQTIEGEQERKSMGELARGHEISEDDAQWLLNLPISYTPAGSVLLVHATPQSPFDAPLPDAPAADFEPYKGAALVVVYAHVHRAFVRRLVDGTIVCNPGSVGLPMDGTSASYMLIDRDGTDIVLRHRRVPFDRSGVVGQAKQMGGPVGELFLKLSGER